MTATTFEREVQELATYWPPSETFYCDECEREFNCYEAAEVHDNRHHDGQRTAATYGLES